MGIFPLNQTAIPNHFFSISEEMKQTGEQSQSSESSEQTSSPTKLLHQISPVPRIEERCRKRKKQSAKVITYQEYIKKS